VKIQSGRNYPHQPQEGLLEIFPREGRVRKRRNTGWGGGGEGLKGQKPSVGGEWVFSGTIQLQIKYHLLGSSNQSKGPCIRIATLSVHITTPKEWMCYCSFDCGIYVPYVSCS